MYNLKNQTSWKININPALVTQAAVKQLTRTLVHVTVTTVVNVPAIVTVLVIAIRANAASELAENKF
jgi:hypothetical protein